MKKIIGITLIVTLLLTACGSTETIKTEAELRAEVLAEMEAAKNSATALDPVSVTNNDAIYEFINETYPDQYTREDFDMWTGFYMDITKSGHDEVVFTTVYGDGKLEKAIVITGDNGKYEIIPSDVELSKYFNDVTYKDDFVVFTQRPGGSGISYTYDNFLVFDGEEIVNTGASLLIEGYVSMPPDVNIEYTGITTFDNAEGDYSSFTHEEVTTGTEEKSEIKKYIYNPESYQFTITDINENTQSNNNASASNNDNVYIGKDLKSGDKVSKYFTIKDFESGEMGSESISFTLEGNDFVSGTLSAINEEDAYMYYFFEFDEPIFDKNILVDDLSGIEEINPTQEMKIFYIDINELRLGEDILLYLLNGGELKAEGLVKEIFYESTPMDTSLYTTITDFKISDSELEKVYGPTIKGLDFENETLYSLDEEIYIDYSKYNLVVVPQQDTINEMGTTPKQVIFSEENASRSLVTILGQLDDVVLAYTPNSLDSSIEPVEKYIGTLKDTRLFVEAYMATDFASVQLFGVYTDNNDNIEYVMISLDDARDPETYEIIMK